MWELPSASAGSPFLVVAHTSAAAGEPVSGSVVSDYAALPSERLIIHGKLATINDAKPAGVVLALQAPTRGAVETIVGNALDQHDQHFDVQILEWEFGGRR